MKKTLMFLSLIITLWWMGSIAFARIIHVPADQPNIQAGIDVAQDGDTVVVADGRYIGEGNRNITFKGKAITVKSQNGSKKTIIDVERGTGFDFRGGLTPASVLDGFTVRAVIQCRSASPTITNCQISGNPGGIYCESSSAIFINCKVAGTATTPSEGVFHAVGSSLTIKDCIIDKPIVVSGSHHNGLFAFQSSL